MAARGGTAGTPPADPWASVEDIDGQAHYRALGISPDASAGQVRAAYREMARKHHPDKGGDPQAFAAVRAAFDVLGDPEARETYDTWMKELKFRLIPGVTQRAAGGEDILLDEFERIGLSCDWRTQLVLVCEVCGRPSTKECYICTARFCDFCTRKRHWKGRFGLHWPMEDKPGMMRDEVAKKQLENKRKEDAQRLIESDPNYRDQSQLKALRAFKEAAAEHQSRPDRKQRYDLRLAKHYTWAQTSRYVYVAVYVPTGYQDKGLHVQPSPYELLVQPEDSPPVVDRALWGQLDPSQPVDTFRAQDNTFITVALPKAEPGVAWRALFRGDSDGARCMEQPYTLREDEDDNLMDFELPFWIERDDVRVKVTGDGVAVEVRNQVSLVRSFWKAPADEAKSKKEVPRVVDCEECSWSLDDGRDASGEPTKVLTVHLVKPPLTGDEVEWKRGVRQDNRRARRDDGPMDRKGYRFFADDEDWFGAEDILMALCFLEAGETFVPPKPWRKYYRPFEQERTARDVDELPKEAQKLLDTLLDNIDNVDEKEPAGRFTEVA